MKRMNLRRVKRLLALELAAAMIVSCLPVTVFAEKTDAEAAELGAEVVEVVAATSGTCGDNITWTLSDNGTLTLTGSGDMYDSGSGESGFWKDWAKSIKHLIISEGITGIGSYAFSFCSNLKTAKLPESLVRVGEYAFYGCSSLTDVWCDSDNISFYQGNDVLMNTPWYYTENYFVLSKDNNSFKHNENSFFNLDHYLFASECEHAKICSAKGYETIVDEDMYFKFCNWSFSAASKSLVKILLESAIKRDGVVVAGCKEGGVAVYNDKLNFSTNLFSRLAYDYECGFFNFNFAETKLLMKKMLERWNGACFGLAASMIFASEGRLTNVFGNTDYYDLDLPKDNDTVKGVIHYYQLAQELFEKERLEKNEFGTTDPKEYLQKLVAEAKKSQSMQRPFIMDYGVGGDGHAVVACGYNYDESTEEHVITIYDENDQSGYHYFRISDDCTSFSFTDGNGTVLENVWSYLGYVSIDTLYNPPTSLQSADSSSGSGGSSESDSQCGEQSVSDTVILNIPAFVPCVIMNAEGEELICTENGYSGTMTVYSEDIITNDQSEFLLEVDPSASFTVTGMEQEQIYDISVEINGEMYASITANADSVILSEAGVQIDGEDDYAFEIWQSSEGKELDLVSVSGTTSGKASSSFDEEFSLTLEQATDDLCVTGYDEDSNSAEMDIDGNVDEISFSGDEPDLGDVETHVAEEPSKPDVADVFKDVSAASWYHDAVQYVYDNGIMTGLNGTTFGPAVTLSRAQFAVILWRLSGAPEMEYSSKFPDVGQNSWYTDAVLWANSVGVVTGYMNGKFGPADTITREQMALMMYRYAKVCGYDCSTLASFTDFTDANRVSAFANEGMQWAVGMKIITGTHNGTALEPQGHASRAECATIIMRFMNAYLQ